MYSSFKFKKEDKALSLMRLPFKSIWRQWTEGYSRAAVPLKFSEELTFGGNSVYDRRPRQRTAIHVRTINMKSRSSISSRCKQISCLPTAVSRSFTRLKSPYLRVNSDRCFSHFRRVKLQFPIRVTESDGRFWNVLVSSQICVSLWFWQANLFRNWEGGTSPLPEDLISANHLNIFLWPLLVIDVECIINSSKRRNFRIESTDRFVTCEDSLISRLFKFLQHLERIS
jgi:hypothetical protein